MSEQIRKRDEVNLLWEMKGEAHDLIDELREKGVSQAKTYMRLRKRLGVEAGQEHFGQMKTYEEVERALEVLRGMRFVKPKKKKNSKAARAKITAHNIARAELKKQKKADLAALMCVNRNGKMAAIARVQRINRIVVRFPRFLQKPVRFFVTKLNET